MSNNALPLPWPWSPGEFDPSSYEHRAQENFDALALAIGNDRTIQGIRLADPSAHPNGVVLAHGSGTFVFTASATSAAVTITHGLGTTPVWFNVMPSEFVVAREDGVNSTDFTVTGAYHDEVARTGNVGFFWVAIG